MSGNSHEDRVDACLRTKNARTRVCVKKVQKNVIFFTFYCWLGESTPTAPVRLSGIAKRLAAFERPQSTLELVDRRVSPPFLDHRSDPPQAW